MWDVQGKTVIMSRLPERGYVGSIPLLCFIVMTCVYGKSVLHNSLKMTWLDTVPSSLFKQTALIFMACVMLSMQCALS